MARDDKKKAGWINKALERKKDKDLSDDNDVENVEDKKSPKPKDDK